ncbi:MAG: hypothetical protein QOE70_2920 [Chthoniobacter sp.]|jgi:hypothetical protein|nr:hypothetical protein [Chthoniobacter sp.]
MTEMAPKSLPLHRARFFIAALATLVGLSAPLRAAAFSPGDPVRLTRSETLMFQGKNFLGAPKGQEFSVLKDDRSLVYVAFFKEDGTVIAVTLPPEALEPCPPEAWGDLLRGVEAFRDQRIEDARRLLLRAGQDPQYRQLAATLTMRINAALATGQQVRSAPAAGRPAFAQALQGLRDTAEQLVTLRHLCLALPLDEGTDRLSGSVLGTPAGAPVLPPSKVNREDLAKRVAVSNRAVWRCRQAMALHRLVEATRYIKEGLKAEPGRPELKAFKELVEKDMDEADERYAAADKMRRFEKGAVHALTALEMGLKLCADHPQLRELKQEMRAAVEERTAPPITPAFLAAARVQTSPQALEEGHNLYTTRCTECHELELLDSRSVSGWQKAVAGMARRANVNDSQQARIVEYLAAAQNGLDAGK